MSSGVLYVKVVDPVKASYGVDSLYYAVVQLAQTTMRSELGKITLDRTFEERDALNANIVKAINESTASWGLQCLRYEIKDISPPRAVKMAMELQAEAERKKRAQILESEGVRQSNINVAEGQKQQAILQSEGKYEEAVNRARGEAEAIRERAKATAEGLNRISSALQADLGKDAASLHLAEQYVAAFAKVAKESTTLLLPSSASDPATMVASAMSVYSRIRPSGGEPRGMPVEGTDGARTPPPRPEASLSSAAKVDDTDTVSAEDPPFTLQRRPAPGGQAGDGSQRYQEWLKVLEKGRAEDQKTLQ
eukprot:scaffold1827_cov421-Prasinococcus_capsulatus_cf.AAC.19